jgi:hypothetical protein
VEITGITIKILTVQLDVTLAGGQDATAEDVRIALADPQEGPDADTVWVQPYAYDPVAEQLQALIAGPYVDPVPDNALQAPARATMLYGRVVDHPEDDPAPLELIEIGRG